MRMEVARKRSYTAISFWAPQGIFYTAVRPRLWRSAWHAPVSIRIVPVLGSTQAGDEPIVRCSYDPALYGQRLCLTFQSHDAYRRLHVRWRILADALWRLVKRRPDVVFADIPVDISDCGDAKVPRDVFRFVKRSGDPHDLLHNLHLLGPRRRLDRPLPGTKNRHRLLSRCRDGFPRLRAESAGCGLSGCPRHPRHRLQTDFFLPSRAAIQPTPARGRDRRSKGSTLRHEPPPLAHRCRRQHVIVGSLHADQLIWWRADSFRDQLAGMLALLDRGGRTLRLGNSSHAACGGGGSPASPRRAQAIAAAATRVALEMLCSRNIQRLFEQMWLERIGVS
jgi:hypothetical protein